MAVIPRSYVDALTESLNMLSEATRSVARLQLSSIVYTDLADLRRQVIEILEPLLAMATDAAAAYAAEAYDMMRELCVGSGINAEAYSNRKPAATEGAIRALVGIAQEHGYESFLTQMLDRVDYEIKRSAAESTLHNGSRDPEKDVRFARVPTGAETCPFCIMLASRGFVYHSAELAGTRHYHANCDCRIVPGWVTSEAGPSRRKSETTVEGYDIDALYDRFVADVKDGKLSLSTARDQSSHVIHWHSDQFSSFGDFEHFIKGAKDIADLQERCIICEQEWSKTGLSDRYYKQLWQAVQAKRTSLLKH